MIREGELELRARACTDKLGLAGKQPQRVPHLSEDLFGGEGADETHRAGRAGHEEVNGRGEVDLVAAVEPRPHGGDHLGAIYGNNLKLVICCDPL